jgi:CPA2 family monovalent cation:H+ antiporter-2
MLFNPAILIEAPLAVIATVLIITVGKSVAAFLIVRAFGHPTTTALTVSAALAQIGEFSFILVGLGLSLGLLPEEGRDLVLAGAILSILLNPFIFSAVERGRTRLLTRISFTGAKAQPAPARPEPAAAPAPPPEPEADKPVMTEMTGHDVVVGLRPRRLLLGAGLIAAGRPCWSSRSGTRRWAPRASGAEVVVGNAADPEVLAAPTSPPRARLFVTLPEAFEAGQVVQQARALNPGIEILARAHSDAAVGHLTGLGATVTVSGEREIALRMLERAPRPCLWRRSKRRPFHRPGTAMMRRPGERSMTEPRSRPNCRCRSRRPSSRWLRAGRTSRTCCSRG